MKYTIHSMAGETCLASLADGRTALIHKSEMSYRAGRYHLSAAAYARLLASV